MTVIVESKVSGQIAVAHRDKTCGTMHGHSYLVEAWYPYTGGDVRHLKAMFDDELAALDHRELPDNLAWAEDIAAYLIGVLPSCVRVIVSRPLEGYAAEARIEK